MKTQKYKNKKTKKQKNRNCFNVLMFRPKAVCFNDQGGQSLIEVLLAIGVFAVGIATVGYLVLDAGVSSRQSVERTQAVLLAKEGLEAARSIRDSDFSNLEAGPHGIALLSNTWAFSSTSDTQGQFTRTVTITDIDANTKKIESTVTWQITQARQGLVTLTDYLTAWNELIGGNWWEQVTTLDVGAEVFDVFVLGNYAYLAVNASKKGMAVIDVSDPENPVEVASVNLDHKGQAIFVSGTHAYVGVEADKGLQIIDVSNPLSPNKVADVDTDDTGTGVYVSGNYAYVSVNEDNEGLDVIDISTPSNPSAPQSIDIGDDGKDVYLSGAYAYVAVEDTHNGFAVVDVSDPMDPSHEASLDIGEEGEAVFVSGTHAYVGNHKVDEGLAIIDISTPTSPTLVSTLDAGDRVNGVFVSENKAYMAVRLVDKGLEIADVSDPAVPTVLITIDVGAIANDVYVSGNYIYVAVGKPDGGFVIIRRH